MNSRKVTGTYGSPDVSVLSDVNRMGVLIKV